MVKATTELLVLCAEMRWFMLKIVTQAATLYVLSHAKKLMVSIEFNEHRRPENTSNKRRSRRVGM